MTIKEIAELCGVSDQTILNWAHRVKSLNQNIWLRISEKLEQGSQEQPSDYDIEETLAIIGEGGKNKTLAALLAENAANKNAVALSGGTAGGIEAFEARLAGVIEAKMREMLPAVRPKAAKKPEDHWFYNKVIKALSIARKWQRKRAVNFEELDTLVGLLVVMRDYLPGEDD